MGLELGQMSQQFLFAGQAREVVADHFVSAQRWLTPRPQADKHAGDNRTVRLNLDALLALAEQVPTTQHVLEEPEKRFNRPAMQEDQTDHLRARAEELCRDSRDG